MVIGTLLARQRFTPNNKYNYCIRVEIKAYDNYSVLASPIDLKYLDKKDGEYKRFGFTLYSRYAWDLTGVKNA